MDTRKFDELTRAFGRGTSRRSILKRMLGIGGATVTGGALLGNTAEAARRSTPTPRPASCPGNQIPVDGQCQCPDGFGKCGAECCPDGEATCCDNACCFGNCYGEGFCCDRVGGIQPIVCTYRSGTDCCAAGDTACCTTDGCCDGACYGGMDGAEICCPTGQYVTPEGHCCPNASDAFCTSDGCCAGECYGGMNGAEFCCPAGQFVTSEGHCCPNASDAYCSSDGCCAGECFGGDDDLAFCCEKVGEIQPIVCTYRSGTDCCGVDDTACCTADGCCDGECYGGMDDAEFCCPAGQFVTPEGGCCPNADDVSCSTDGCCDGDCYGGEDGSALCCPASGYLCNNEACCLNDENCCTEDGCCTGYCYGGDHDDSYCCQGILCEDSDGDFCREGGECCENYDCPNDPVTCQTGVCNDNGMCEHEGGGCTGTDSCCGGVCCDPGSCCQNEGGYSICLNADLGNCCTVQDCPGEETRPCWEQQCQYDSENGSSWCASVNTCTGRDEICCDNVCIQGRVCPECSVDSDCGFPYCQNDTTVLQPACTSRGECVATQAPCISIDPCHPSVCQGGQCVTVAPDTCHPSSGTICCPPGWSCLLPDATECGCLQQYVCPDGSCAACCSANDCISNELGSPGCIECQGGSCVAINENGSCNDGFGTCYGGYCQSN